jgi:hypothetical protein
LPWTRRRSPYRELSAAHRQFAVAETLAHLINLANEGAVRVVSGSPTIVYAPAA